MAYEPYSFSMFLRRFAPGFSRIGQPTKVRDTYSPQHIRDKKFAIAKTKDEVVEEYALVARKTYGRVFLGVVAAVVGVFSFFYLVETGSDFYLLAAMAAIAYGSYKWWHAGAAYSNYQQFEMRPIIVPVEDIREPSITPYWLTGEKPTFTSKGVKAK